MTIAEILVPLTGAPEDAGALDSALALAAPSGAHVTALFAAEDARDVVSAADLHQSAPARGARIAAARDRARVALVTAARKADARIQSAPEKYGTLSTCYREADGALVDALTGAARFCDLVVFPCGAAQGEIRDAFSRVLIQSEKPVLLAGREPLVAAPQSIAIAWDGSLPAARALTAALPLLQHARAVELMIVGECSGLAAAEAIDYLALHAVAVTLRSLPSAPVPVGETLLAAARAADLLVLGAYGHSRLAERIFGGVTAHILAHAQKAILLAH